jgi:hypothetical protein
MKRRNLRVILAVAMVAMSLTACGKSKDNSDVADSNSSSTGNNNDIFVTVEKESTEEISSEEICSTEEEVDTEDFYQDVDSQETIIESDTDDSASSSTSSNDIFVTVETEVETYVSPENAEPAMGFNELADYHTYEVPEVIANGKAWQEFIASEYYTDDVEFNFAVTEDRISAEYYGDDYEVLVEYLGTTGIAVIDCKTYALIAEFDD